MTTTARVRDVGELIAILPFTFGFELTGSLVGVGLRQGRMGPLQRIDLPADPDQMLPPQHAQMCVRNLSGDADTVLVIVFEQSPGQGRALVRQYLDLCRGAGMDTPVLGIVRDGRWWQAQAGTSMAVPNDPGRAVPAPEDVPASFAFVMSGVAPLPGRDSLSGLLRARRGDPTAVGRELRRRRRRGRPHLHVARAWATVLTPHRVGLAQDAPLTCDVVAAAAHGLEDVAWRDALLSWLTPGLWPQLDDDSVTARRVAWALGPAWNRHESLIPDVGTTARGRDGVEADDLTVACDGHTAWAAAAQDRLIQLLTAVPPGDQAPTATLLAAFLWARGNAAFATCAVDHALQDRPDYVLAGLLAGLLDSGVTARQAARSGPGRAPRPACN